MLNLKIGDKILADAFSQNTRTAYEKCWEYFSEFCKDAESMQASPETIIDFLTEMATTPRPKSGKILSMGTISMCRSAINRKYLDADKQSPTAHPKIDTLMKALHRLRGAPPRRVHALREYHIKKIITHCGTTPRGLRDAAIITIGFAAALRRSELCSLTVDDIEILQPNSSKKRQMILTINKSKTDQTGQGQKIAVPEGKFLQPIECLLRWLNTANITDGYVFQTMRRGGALRGMPMHHSDIPRIVKYYAKAIGLNPADFAAHSLRAGFVTSAAVHHAQLHKIMEITRHKNPQTVMKYIRDANYFHDHAGEKFL